ncbi:NAD(P)-dependent alcohol dehydrogenase [Magnetospirillum sp. 15-1]|uniref:NAD(P)-dependent alcohol dehydrogenase n=1 Tax=Magnetospirillum sp. 15-1 TaxID=1979370 RepID=UPI000BBCC42B|nr:NAD(P)-dependent alcohol dehydrogenase [Magnetospirillum sp. 15-1]
MKVNAAVTRAKHAPMSLEVLDLAEPRDGEILVRVVATGVCHTDIAMRDQTYPVPQPIVLGHEGAGVVEKVGRGVTKVAVGDHVVMSYNSCGHCDSCNEHAPNYCHDFFGHNFAGVRPDGTSALSKGTEVIHGNFFGQSSFANFALCHERNVVKVSKDAPLELLGPLACGIQTGAGAVINALKVGPGRTIAVFGAGSVGLSAVMAARVVGAITIIAVDVVPERLTMAKTLGATHTLNPKDVDVVAEIMKITGTGVDFSFESTGIPAVIRNAMESLAPRGTCGIVGAASLDTEITLNAMHLMTAGRSIRGIVEGDSTPDVFIPQLIELHRQGRFPFDKLVSFYPYEKINQAVEDAETGKAIKPIIRMA